LILERRFYARDTVKVAKELLGKILVRKIDDNILSGMIVETEAYRSSDDPASHSYRGITNRNKVMFGEVGYSYVYFTYGTYYCLNIVAKDPNTKAGAVLIRAIEPLEGIEVMKKHRGKELYDLTNGPGKLTQALKIDKSLNGIDVTREGELYIKNGYDIDENDIIATPRIGIKIALDKYWRFCIKNNRFVSKAKPLYIS
jgi:DNA-3-methyladenine glycosylase